jgi:Conserved TM helix
MAILAQQDAGAILQQTWTNIATWTPRFVGFLLILVIGYFVAKVIAKVLGKVLERAGFDRAVERGGVKRMLARSQYDASGLLSQLVFYAVMLFVLQLAFGVFGPNPISDIIRSIIAFLPRIFVAIVIVVIAAAIANGVREVVQSTTGGLPYGNALATLAYVGILAIGVFAALNQVDIAPAIVNGLFYGILAVIAGSAIIAIGGGGIMPMRRKWEEYLSRAEQEAPRIREQHAASRDTQASSTG